MKDMGTQKYTTELFAKTKIWKPKNTPLTNERIKKNRNMFTTRSDSGRKKNVIMPISGTHRKIRDNPTK